MERIKTELGDLPVNYGMNAMAMFSEDRGIGINEVFSLDYEKLSLMDLMGLLYVGLKDGARKAKEDCKFPSLEELLDYADDHSEIISDISTIFQNQMTSKKSGEGSKKK